MAKAMQTIKKVKTVKGTSSSGASGTVSCNMCKGTGRLKAGYNKKKK